ncbi:hypothetical protein CS542_08325 [Pedobacter sp. IW39]|nr:hypothetical protein CS542_08325 [Pedobacter sp. IW39]
MIFLVSFFTIGLPAKSGGRWSDGRYRTQWNRYLVTRLDKSGNTVKGIEFCKELMAVIIFTIDSLTQNNQYKTDPRLSRNQTKIDGNQFVLGRFRRDLLEVQHLYARGADINMADYDGRTALYLAACEGRTILCLI